MNNLDLFSNELADTGGLPSIINFQFFVVSKCLFKQLFFVTLEERINSFVNLLFVLNKLVVDTFLQSENVVIYFIIGFVQLLKKNYILIAFLFCFIDCIQNIDVGWLCTLDEVLLGMLNNAVGT